MPFIVRSRDPRVREDDGFSDQEEMRCSANFRSVILATAGIHFLRAVLAPTESTLPPLFDLQQYRARASDLA